MSRKALTIRIDTRYHRFCIHKQTWEAIGSPAFVRFGYEPERRKLLLLGAGSNMYKAVRVRFNADGSIYIHTKSLIEAIRSTSDILQQSGSYLLAGHPAKTESAIIFSVEDAVFLPEQAERIEE